MQPALIRPAANQTLTFAALSKRTKKASCLWKPSFAVILGLVGVSLAQAQTLTVLYSFKGGTDGASSYAGLVRDNAGNLYGTTYDGGNQNCASGCGTVFKLLATGKKTQL